MSRAKAIIVEVPEGSKQTLPVDPAVRIPPSQITIAPVEEEDLYSFAECFYAVYEATQPDAMNKLEPLNRRPDVETRNKRFGKRIHPVLSEPGIHYIKATHASTNEILGFAGWVSPGVRVCNPLLYSAIKDFGFAEREGWTDADIEEIWSGVDVAAWDAKLRENDVERSKVMAGESHWFLAPLMTYPKHQGRGVGKLLLQWAIDQADKTNPPTAMYLETSKIARPVYMHVGFQRHGHGSVMIRRGPLSSE